MKKLYQKLKKCSINKSNTLKKNFAILYINFYIKSYTKSGYYI